MKKKITIIILFLSFIELYLLFRTFINIYIIKTNNEKLSNILLIININEPYIAYYNKGNIFYKNQKYDKAIYYYEKALLHNPKEKHICNIKNNLVYAKIKNNDIDNIEYDQCINKTQIDIINNSTKNKYNIINDENYTATSKREKELEMSKNENNDIDIPRKYKWFMI